MGNFAGCHNFLKVHTYINHIFEGMGRLYVKKSATMAAHLLDESIDIGFCVSRLRHSTLDGQRSSPRRLEQVPDGQWSRSQTASGAGTGRPLSLPRPGPSAPRHRQANSRPPETDSDRTSQTVTWRSQSMTSIVDLIIFQFFQLRPQDH